MSIVCRVPIISCGNFLFSVKGYIEYFIDELMIERVMSGKYVNKKYFSDKEEAQ